MSAAQQIENYVEESLELLADDGFEVIEKERFQGSQFRAVAFRSEQTRELVFVFKKIGRLSANKMKEFTDDAYAYAMQTRPANLLWIYAVALAAEAADEVVEGVTDATPTVQGGHLTLPIIYDADADDVYFCKDLEIKQLATFVEKYLVLD